MMWSCVYVFCRELISVAKLKKKRRRNFRSCNKSEYRSYGILIFCDTKWLSQSLLISYVFLYVSLNCREEELQAQKRQKRKIKGNPRLSFSEDIENGSEDDEGENSECNSI